MKLNELKPVEGAKHAKKRVGRGIGSGNGKLREEVLKVKTLVQVAV